VRNNVVKSDGDDAADPAGITMSLYNMTKLVHNMNVHECTIIFKCVGIHIPQTRHTWSPRLIFRVKSLVGPLFEVFTYNWGESGTFKLISINGYTFACSPIRTLNRSNWAIACWKIRSPIGEKLISSINNSYNFNKVRYPPCPLFKTNCVPVTISWGGGGRDKHVW
jgi:hypothetical protein